MVGEGAHTLHENFVLARVPERIALLRELIRAL
jgi:hypothetical protein